MAKKQKKAKNEQSPKKIGFQSYPHLMAIKPREKYVFHSDYFIVDDKYATIMSFFRPEGASVDFGPFWGVNKIPSGLPRGVDVILFDQVRRQTEHWLREHQNRAEGVARMNEREQTNTGTSTARNNASKKSMDMEVIADELNNGASYLNVKSRILVRAPSLEQLDDAVQWLERLYIDRFSILTASPYIGEQRKELSTLFSKMDRKEGRGFYYTSTEYAGSHFLVTHGLDDPTGEYVGDMTGDVNTSAILFDANKYDHHVVVSDDNYDDKLGRVHVADMWGSKISQSCLLNNHKVAHLILDGVDLRQVGPPLKNLTFKIDMSRGDVNMFEMFGERKDQLSIFPAQLQKLVLMGEQAYETTDSDRSVIRGSLEEIATQFYIGQRMWYENAAANQHKLRVVGIPHDEVPKLEVFVSYLDTAYKSMTNRTARDDEKLHALSILQTTFRNMLSNNGDLFNTITNPAIDDAKTGRRVIYDFSQLMLRGVGIAMAQLVNVVGFAVGNLGKGDTLVIHGTELIDDGVKAYLMTQFNRLYDKGGRIVFCYNHTDKMLKDREFCQFDTSNYTIFGCLTDTLLKQYQSALGQDIPADLAQLILTKSEDVSYIRRGYDNVVFRRKLQLGLPKKVQQRG